MNRMLRKLMNARILTWGKQDFQLRSKSAHSRRLEYVCLDSSLNTKQLLWHVCFMVRTGNSSTESTKVYIDNIKTNQKIDNSQSKRVDSKTNSSKLRFEEDVIWETNVCQPNCLIVCKRTPHSLMGFGLRWKFSMPYRKTQ